jgi:SAM-dependent methyltransferase
VLALPVLAAGTAPDNRAAWNTISRVYQETKQIATDRVVYGPHCPDEDELGLLGDVDGRRVLVLGCGGGQDCIALARRGAQVVGIDLSDKQIEYGRRLAEREGVLVTLLQGDAGELRDIDDESQDQVLSIYALQFVEQLGRALNEAFRVLKPDGALVVSLNHPVDACLEDVPPFGVLKGYWEPELDWQWEFPEQQVSARMREWHRPLSEWFSLLHGAGFRIDRLLEPPPVEAPPDLQEDPHRLEKQRLIPRTMIIRAVKP